MRISGLATAMQAGTSANLTVTLSGASGSNASAYDCTGDGTASAFVNYCSASGWATISAGQTSTTIPVIAMDDGMYEANDEYFSVELSDPSGASLAAASNRRLGP